MLWGGVSSVGGHGWLLIENFLGWCNFGWSYGKETKSGRGGRDRIRILRKGRVCERINGVIML